MKRAVPGSLKRTVAQVVGVGLLALTLAACERDAQPVATRPTAQDDLVLTTNPVALACSGCHAPQAPVDAAIPGLSNRSADEIASLMRQYREDADGTTVMHRIARGYSDAEINAVARQLGQKEAN